MTAYSANATANTSVKDNPSLAMIKTFWRMRLYKTLREPIVLGLLEIDGGAFRFATMSWDEYWTSAPQAFREQLQDLRSTWAAYIGSGFSQSCTAPYTDAYLGLIRAVLGQGGIKQCSHRRFLSKILSFENFVLKFHDKPSPFAAATASFRNPIFLSLAGIRKNNRNDPSLLPLVVATDRESPELYFHYRKQSLLKNTDDNVLLFRLADPAKRPHSFKGLHLLAGNLFSEWESRIEQRSQLLTEKVLTPLLSKADGRKQTGGQQALRILDIGSGAGLLTSRVVSKMLKLGILNGRKTELSLLDIISTEPKKHFATPNILSGLAKLEYISSDYMKWLNSKQIKGFRRFDLVFLFRILHNFSEFRIHALPPAPSSGACARSRYRWVPHLSEYYRAISLVFPQSMDQMSNTFGTRHHFHPARMFNLHSLVTPDGRSLIQRLAEISSGILIEDGDLSSETLVNHLSQYAAGSIRVYDLSQALRLSINHVYWISNKECDVPLRGKMIWPN